ncbi:hypothetical protein D3C71_1333440 [compost metagenome]
MNIQNDDRPVIPLQKLGGHNADYADIPAFPRQYDDMRKWAAVQLLLKSGRRFRNDALHDHLPLFIQHVQFRGKLFRVICVFCRQQGDRSSRVIQPSAGIDPGSQCKSDIDRPDPLDRNRAHFQQRPNPGIPGSAHTGKPPPDQCPVLAEQRHQVGDRSNRNDFCPFLGDVCAKKGLSQLVGYPDSAQSLERIRAIRQLGVNERVCRRQNLGRLMVVRNDDVHTKLIGISNLTAGADSCVDGKDQRNSLLQRPIQRMIMQPVAFIGAVGNINVKGCSQPAQQVNHQRCAGYPVRVVIAVYENMLPVLKGSADSGNSLLHALEQKRIMLLFSTSADKLQRFLGLRHSPCG